MSELIRFGVSIEEELLHSFDRFIAERSYTNRSEAIRDLIRKTLADRDWDEGGEAAGGIVLVFDHHRRELSERLTDIQHHALDIVVSSLHVHLSPEHCLEVIVVRGPVERIRRLADELGSQKGVYHCAVARVAAGDSPPAATGSGPGHAHSHAPGSGPGHAHPHPPGSAPGHAHPHQP